MIVVSDTTPIIALIKAGKLDILETKKFCLQKKL